MTFSDIPAEKCQEYAAIVKKIVTKIATYDEIGIALGRGDTLRWDHNFNTAAEFEEALMEAIHHGEQIHAWVPDDTDYQMYEISRDAEWIPVTKEEFNLKAGRVSTGEVSATSEITGDYSKTFIADMWSPIPVTPEILIGLTNTHVAVDCSNEASEEILGQSGCKSIERAVADYLRLVGVETDPDKLTGSPVGPGLFVMISMDDERNAVKLFVGATFLMARHQHDEGSVGYSRCIQLPLSIVKDPSLQSTCLNMALYLVHDFVDTLLEQNPGRPDGREE
jgi:hypothetical protein